jgi:hypothetical protein
MRFSKPYICRLPDAYPIDLTPILCAVTVDAYIVCNGASPTGT